MTTWAYSLDNNTWKILSSPPVGSTWGHALVYDSKDDRVILSGGYCYQPANSQIFNYTLAYNGSANSWIDLNPPTNPGKRSGHALAYDSESDRVILFGGDTWTFGADLGISPYVVSTSPVSHAMDVPVKTNITIRFNMPMNTTATEGAISSTPSITGTYSWDSASMNMTWKPSSDLQLNTKYTVTITTDAKSETGMNMKSPYIFSFTTAQPPDTFPPYIVRTTPANSTNNIPVNTAIAIEWNESMNRSSAEVAFSSIPTVSCAWSWTGATQTCALNLPLMLDTSYTITISTKARDFAGNNMVAPYIFSFSTAKLPDIYPPHIVSTYPVGGTGNIAINTAIIIEWNESMNQASVMGAFSSSPSISCAWTWIAATYMCKPDTLLNSDTTYTITIEATAKDLAGNQMKAPYVFSFTASAVQDLSPPYVVVTIPSRDATDVAVDTSIVIEWNESMDRSSAEGAFSSTPTVSCAWSWDGVKQKCTPRAPLEPGRNYTVLIAATALDAAGNHLLIPYAFYFTTMGTPANDGIASMTLYAITVLFLIVFMLILLMLLMRRGARPSQAKKDEAKGNKKNVVIEEKKAPAGTEKRHVDSRKRAIENIRKRKERAKR
jgi:hypothetical protein